MIKLLKFLVAIWANGSATDHNELALTEELHSAGLGLELVSKEYSATFISGLTCWVYHCINTIIESTFCSTLDTFLLTIWDAEFTDFSF